ncbi:MAG: tryptophan synthase subunit alpha [Cytophagales bacterium]
MLHQNRINQLFSEKKEKILSVYFTAGYPHLNDTRTVLKSLQDSGVDFVEIGIPFSDPVADGPVIQHSSEVALSNGMSMKLLFEQLDGVRNEINIPLVLMGYVNPVLQFGVEQFCQKCQALGIDAVILPDLPILEYQTHFKDIFEKYGLSFVFLITPQSSEKRIKEIDEISNSFIYLVSSAGTTGVKTGISDAQVEYFSRIKSYQLKNPTMVGFGISDKFSFDKACEYAKGCIIGSAFIKALGNDSPLGLEEKIKGFVGSVRA